jgi:hypothetical protein
MSDIYFGSILTIAASDAKDSTGGFFAYLPAADSDKRTAKSRTFFIVKRLSSDLLVYVKS